MASERDEQQAADWLRRAAERLPEAQYTYGRMLVDGRGVAPDLEGARAWISRASAADMPEAQVALAEMMVNGRGGLRDPAAALDLFEKAAAHGHSGAMFALGALHAGGHDLPEDRATAQKNPVEARRWLEQAVAQGIEEGHDDLAALPVPAVQ